MSTLITPLQHILNERGLSPYQLMQMSGTTNYAVYAAANGISMSKENAEKFAQALGVEVERLYGPPVHVSDNPPPKRRRGRRRA